MLWHCIKKNKEGNAMVPSHYTFLGYWRAMATKSIKLIFSSWRLVGAIVGFLFFIVMLFNKEIGDKLFEQWKGFPRWWSAAIVLILFLWGLMKAIYERDENLYLAYKELEDKYKTKITGEIDQITLINSASGDIVITGDSTLVFMTVSIRNIGEPSSLEKWKLRIQLQDKKEVDAEMREFPRKELIFNRGEHPLRFKGSNALYTKAMDPIDRGKMIRGLLLFKVPNIRDTELNNSNFVLSFCDIFGHEYSLTKIVIAASESDVLSYPGIEIAD